MDVTQPTIFVIAGGLALWLLWIALIAHRGR